MTSVVLRCFSFRKALAFDVQSSTCAGSGAHLPCMGHTCTEVLMPGIHRCPQTVALEWHARGNIGRFLSSFPVEKMVRQALVFTASMPIIMPVAWSCRTACLFDPQRSATCRCHMQLETHHCRHCHVAQKRSTNFKIFVVRTCCRVRPKVRCL